jgi:N6-adenosine-specific RNA methylase IME4
MTIILVVLGVIAVCFVAVIAVGAPYLPTLTPQVKAALALADLQPGDTLLELGCGDGKVLIAAAEQGIKVVGYELNPILALVAWVRTRRYGKNVRIIWGNFWLKQWPESQAIFVFLLPRYMEKLDKKIVQYTTKPVKLVSFAFEVPGKKAAREQQGVFLYTY